MGFTQEHDLQRKVLLTSALCLIGAAIASYCLYRDVTSAGRSGTGEVVAEVIHRESRVRRKPMGAYVWSNLEEAQSLYRKDSVQTGDESAVALRLRDGTTLELGEQSLLVLEDNQDLSLQFVRGTAVLHGADGDSKISIGKDGKAKIEKLPVKLLEPASFAEVFSKEVAPRPIAFRWEVTKTTGSIDLADIQLEVSSGESFRKSTTQVLPIRAPAIETAPWGVTAPLKPGRYLWRITQKGEALAPPRSLRVIVAKPLHSVSPANGETIARWGTTGFLPFRWNPEEEISKSVEHRLEIAKDADFKSLLREERVDSESGGIRLTGISDGNHYWRIRSIFADGEVSSRVHRFTLAQKKSLAIALRSPDNRASLEFRPETRFSWDGDTQSDLSYEWELAQFENGTARILSKVTSTTPSVLWKTLGRGDYRWKVTATFENQTIGSSAWSEFSVFEGKPIALKAPADRASILYWENPPAFDLEWNEEQKSLNHRVYVVEVASDPLFSTILKSEKIVSFKASSRTLGIAPGDYYWRVRSVEKDDSNIKTSPVYSFHFGQYPTLAPPALEGPALGKSFNPLVREETPLLSWRPVKGAEAYEVTVTRKETRALATDSEVLFLKEVTSDTNFEMKGLKTEGTYVWTVRSIDQIKRPGEAAPQKTFQFTYGARLRAPKLVAPEVQ